MTQGIMSDNLKAYLVMQLILHLVIGGSWIVAIFISWVETK